MEKGDKDYEVTVNFDRCGVRKMFASFAKLKNASSQLNRMLDLFIKYI